jgi:hypothetical protein
MTIDLERGKFLRVREGAGCTVTAHVGSLWITEQDNPRDVILRPGQSFTLRRRGLALVEAFSNASISLVTSGQRGRNKRDNSTRDTSAVALIHPN